MAEVLALDRVTAGYGPTVVLEEVSFALDEGESVSLIGRNGVGKTTLLATVMGHTTLHDGTLRYAGDDLRKVPIFRRARAGLGLVPQEREIFPSLTVRENLEVGARPGRWTLDTVMELFPNLRERAGNYGNQLSGGEQQMLAIARALMGNPKVLLLDEPSEGLAPLIVAELMRVMTTLRDDEGLSIVLVEQNARVALDFSRRAVVLDKGRIVHDGDSAELRETEGMLDKLMGVGAG